jgi:hypothetical protein
MPCITRRAIKERPVFRAAATHHPREEGVNIIHISWSTSSSSPVQITMAMAMLAAPPIGASISSGVQEE